MRKIVLIFPGIGYHVDKPLLYFAAKLARNKGYDTVIPVNYGGFRQGIKGDAEKMREAFESALQQADQAAGSEADRFTPEDEILVVSKSIGTAVAAAFQQKHGFPAKNIYFTPVKQSFLFMRPQSGIVFHGTADPWAETADIREGCSHLQLPLFITEGVNHSMESGDALRDLEILTQIIRHCDDYLSE